MKADLIYRVKGRSNAGRAWYECFSCASQHRHEIEWTQEAQETRSCDSCGRELKALEPYKGRLLEGADPVQRLTNLLISGRAVLYSPVSQPGFFKP